MIVNKEDTNNKILWDQMTLQGGQDDEGDSSKSAEKSNIGQDVEIPQADRHGSLLIRTIA